MRNLFSSLTGCCATNSFSLFDDCIGQSTCTIQTSGFMSSLPDSNGAAAQDACPDITHGKFKGVCKAAGTPVPAPTQGSEPTTRNPVGVPLPSPSQAPVLAPSAMPIGSSCLMLTGVTDGPSMSKNAAARAVELYATCDITDLSVYSLVMYVYVSTATTYTAASQALSGSLVSGAFYYVAQSSSAFTTWFDFSAGNTSAWRESSRGRPRSALPDSSLSFFPIAFLC
jgi:hypothetical protein